MSSKILVADDSLTIQKVIGITLANSGYELVECIKEEELLSTVKSTEFDLILLDFNLSENKSGYDLALEIKKIHPKAGIIVMLGTFDSIDESKFGDYGINDKIIKPFESAKFIKKCKDVLENAEEFVLVDIEIDEDGNETIISETSEPAVSELDSWVVEAPTQINKAENLFEEPEQNYHTTESTLDPLKSEIQGWGFDVNVNLEEKYNKQFPPIIEDVPAPQIIERLQSSSHFVEEVEEDDDQTDPSFHVPLDLNRNLLEEIDEEVSAEAFWAVDEILPVQSDDSEDITDTRLDEVTADLTDTVNAFKKKESETNSVEVANINMDELVAKLKTALLPHIESMVKEYCKETATKVSWEVIPDLAENLIKKEIKEISESVH
jgi:DNA-binding response OmpR family regulator